MIRCIEIHLSYNKTPNISETSRLFWNGNQSLFFPNHLLLAVWWCLFLIDNTMSSWRTWRRMRFWGRTSTSSEVMNPVSPDRTSPEVMFPLYSHQSCSLYRCFKDPCGKRHGGRRRSQDLSGRDVGGAEPEWRHRWRGGRHDDGFMNLWARSPHVRRLWRSGSRCLQENCIS